MTKLESLAKDCIENHTHRLIDKPTKQDIYLREESIFIQGYRQSEKRIAELEAQIEQMKCCQNCKNTWNGYRMNICDDCKRLEGQIFSNTLTSDNWELKEKR
jgi:hypothetical protein